MTAPDRRAHAAGCPDRPHSHELFRRGTAGSSDRTLVAWATFTGGWIEVQTWPVTAAGMSEAAAWIADAAPVWLGSRYPARPDDALLLLQAVS